MVKKQYNQQQKMAIVKSGKTGECRTGRIAIPSSLYTGSMMITVDFVVNIPSGDSIKRKVIESWIKFTILT